MNSHYSAAKGAHDLLAIRNRRILETIARGDDVRVPERKPSGKASRGRLSPAGMVLIDQLERRLSAMGVPR